ncbi:MAG: EF-hand domain-containing protein, partial [Candidatus Poseidoniales archaeon]
MAEPQEFDASVPDGIEVDDAAAYFGVTESSDALHSMLAMNQRDAMVKFFSLLSDIVLLPGEFNFEAASDRMQCEGGEIYYLVAGHLGLMSLQDPLSRFIGETDSMGESSSADASLTDEEKEKLGGVADPMRLMKILAVGFSTGGDAEFLKYLDAMTSYINNPKESKETLLRINNELDASLDVEGHVLPIPTLASSTASASQIDISLKVEMQESQSTEPPEDVPLPSSIPLPSIEEETSESNDVPLPSSNKVELPKVEVVEAETQKIESDKQMERATQDAFAGAFTLGLNDDDPQEDLTEPTTEDLLSTLAEENETEEEDVQHVLEFEDPLQSQITIEEPSEEQIEPAQEEEFVSAAERFIAADTDGSGALSVEELAEATGTSIEEAERLHKEADTDGDGTVSLGEFVSSEAGEKAQALPRPIAPVRKPLGGQQPQPQQQPQQQSQQQPQQWQQQPQQWQQQPQQWQQQPQQWQQPQPTIRSGVFCRGCG